MNKRYCIFAAHYLPHMGGIERYVYNLAEKLVEHGDEVTIVTSAMENLPRYEKMNGISVYRVSAYMFLQGRYPVLKYDFQTKKIFRILQQKQFDMVILNARFYMHSICGAVFAKKNKIPCIVLEHGSGHLTVHKPIVDFMGRVYEHLHTEVLKHLCNNFYGTCEACNTWLKHFGIQSKGTIYNAINMQEVEQSLLQSGEFRKKYHIDGQAMVVAFTGRLIKEKGILSLISAVEKLNEHGHRLYLFIAGTGDLEAEIYQKASEYIIPLGQISHQEVFQMLEESDIYCLPSDSEAFCGGVLEAVACKCYVITTYQGGSRELISSKELGKIIEKNDPETVYFALKECIENWKECENAIEKAYEKLIHNYTWDIIVEQVRELEVK